MTIPIARQYYFAHIASTLESMNVDIDRLLSRNSIPEWQYLDPEDPIPLIHFIQMFEIGARAVGDDQFGTAVARQNAMNSFASFGEKIAGAFTVYEALRNVSRLARDQVTTLQVWLARRPDGVLLCRKQFVSHPDIKLALLQLEQYTLTEFVRIVRLGAGADWCPTATYLASSKMPMVESWGSFTDTTFYFEMPYSAIFVPNHILCRPINGQSTCSERSDSAAGIRRQKSQIGQDFVGDLRALLRSLLRQKCANIETASEIAGISPRTLRRRLADRGTSFRKTLEQSRYQMATKLLLESDREIAEISDLVGYEHPQHFVRAFRRWSGSTPRIYRESNLTTE